MADSFGAGAKALHDVAQIEPQRRQHLVVARAAEVQPPATLTDARGEQVFERGLPVFLIERDMPLAALMRSSDLGQCFANQLEI